MADVVESFISALYFDKGLDYVSKFCEVCLFPRLTVRLWAGKLIDFRPSVTVVVVSEIKSI